MPKKKNPLQNTTCASRLSAQVKNEAPSVPEKPEHNKGHSFFRRSVQGYLLSSQDWNRSRVNITSLINNPEKSAGARRWEGGGKWSDQNISPALFYLLSFLCTLFDSVKYMPLACSRLSDEVGKGSKQERN